ncbi:MAG: tetratricopeptide repeat protein [Steroidobacteraceae bacterium]
MRRLLLVLCGALFSVSGWAATLEEAAELFTARKWAEAAAAYQEIVNREPANALALIRLARSRAASGEPEKALTALQAWIATGNSSYLAVMAMPEFESLRTDPRFVAMVEPLKPCNTPEYRQFDFWLGDWDVESPASPGRVSRNRIIRINNGCTLREEYTSPGGYAGTSLNFYDATRKLWHQTWIDNQGAALYLEGGLQGKSMVLATTADPQQVNRITWTLLDDGRVRQLWESTTDGGKTWTTVFDGYYRKREGG